MPGTPFHLARRFFDVALARGLSQAERAEVESLLNRGLSKVFFDQPTADQRHGYEAAAVVRGSGSVSADLIVAALLHDVAKRHAGLGLIGRTIASLFILLRLPLTKRMSQYRDHGQIAAEELGSLGAPRLAVDFARHHHDERPDFIDPETWSVLIDADRPAKPWARPRTPISSPET